MSTPNRGESKEGESQQSRREEGTSTGSGGGNGFYWALGGAALAGAGVAALLYFTSRNENDSGPGPRVTLVEDGLREQVREIFRTRDISQENCNICLEPLRSEDKQDQQSMMLRCGHVFHQPCIEAWLQSRERDGHCPTCPACRAPDPANFLGLNIHPYCQ